MIAIIDGILALPVVRWLLLAATAAAVVTALWCRGQLGVVRMQRDVAQGQAATYWAHLDVQNAAIRQSGEEFKSQQRQMAHAAAKADQIKAESDSWRKKAMNTPLTGTCDEMLDQVIEAVRR